MTDVTTSSYVQDLLDRAAGLGNSDGDPRLKAILRDMLEQTCHIIERHNVTEDELWVAVNYLVEAAPELGLVVPGVGLEHFMDLVLDARDAEAGLSGGTPRTIEGPLYVGGAPLSDRSATMSEQEEKGERLIIRGGVQAADGTPIPNAIVDVWHADRSGFYSHFDPTKTQAPFNNRRRIRVGDDGQYEVRTIMPSGYSVPPSGPTDRLMKAVGRHGDRPAHVHFFADAAGYRHLTTQINIADDPLVDDDFAFGTRDGLAPAIERQDGVATIRFDLVLLADDKRAAYERSNRKRLVVDA